MTDDDDDRIRSVVAEWHRATEAGDLGSVLALMTDDVAFFTPGQPPFGKETFAANFANMVRTHRIVPSGEVLEVRVDGGIAYAVSRLEVRVESRSGAVVNVMAGHAMSVFQRGDDGRWRIRRDANLLAPSRRESQELPPIDPARVPEEIVTRRLHIRRPIPEDAEALFAATSDPAVMRWMDFQQHRDVAEVRAFLDGAAPRWTAAREFYWVIEDEDGDVIGAIAAHPSEGSVGIGYFLRRSAWGRGLATEAAGAITRWLVDGRVMPRIWATVDPDNVASQRVLEKLGFEREGLMRAAANRPQCSAEPSDSLLYARVVPARQ